MSKTKTPKPEIERIEVLISPADFPRTRAALDALKRTVVEEATSHAKHKNLPDGVVPSLVSTLMHLSKTVMQGNIEHLQEMFPELDSTRIEEITQPAVPQVKTKIRGH